MYPIRVQQDIRQGFSSSPVDKIKPASYGVDVIVIAISHAGIYVYFLVHYPTRDLQRRLGLLK